jgi:hypothetical protein
MPKCGQCNKFCGYDDPPTVEFDSEPEIDPAGEVLASIHVTLLSSCCSETVKEATVDVSQTVELPDGHEGEGHELEITYDEPEGQSKTDGKPGTPMRYRRTFYGGSFDWTVKCSCGNLSLTGTAEGFEQASSMEEVS